MFRICGFYSCYLVLMRSFFFFRVFFSSFLFEVVETWYDINAKFIAQLFIIFFFYYFSRYNDERKKLAYLILSNTFYRFSLQFFH